MAATLVAKDRSEGVPERGDVGVLQLERTRMGIIIHRDIIIIEPARALVMIFEPRMEWYTVMC
jgi:hypothetical protein